jgi:hypothetical protein
MEADDTSMLDVGFEKLLCVQTGEAGETAKRLEDGVAACGPAIAVELQDAADCLNLQAAKEPERGFGSVARSKQKDQRKRIAEQLAEVLDDVATVEEFAEVVDVLGTIMQATEVVEVIAEVIDEVETVLDEAVDTAPEDSRSVDHGIANGFEGALPTMHDKVDHEEAFVGKSKGALRRARARATDDAWHLAALIIEGGHCRAQAIAAGDWEVRLRAFEGKVRHALLKEELRVVKLDLHAVKRRSPEHR